MLFRLAPTLMTLNGWNVPLAEIQSSYGGHQKNFNEDRSITLAAKCRPMILVSKNIKYMRRFVWTPSWSAVKSHFGREGRNFLNFRFLTYDVTSAARAWTCPACAGCAHAVAQPTCASVRCLYGFKTEKTSVVGYFIAKYAQMPIFNSNLTSTVQWN